MPEPALKLLAANVESTDEAFVTAAYSDSAIVELLTRRIQEATTATVAFLEHGIWENGNPQFVNDPKFFQELMASRK